MTTVGLEVKQSFKTKDFYFVVDGKPIQDPVNPKGVTLKGIMEAEPKAPKDTKVFIIFGLDFGYSIEAIRTVYPNSVIFCYEPSDLLVEEVMSRRKQELLKMTNLLITSNIEILIEKIHLKYGKSVAAYVLPLERWKTMFPAEFKTFLEKIQTLVMVKGMSKVTKEIRYKPWVSNFLENLPTYVKGNHLKKMWKCLSPQTPVVICSAGPSLKKNIELLKGVEDKVVIVAVNSAYESLKHYGIEPHIVVAIESVDCSSMMSNCGEMNTTFLAPLVVHPNMLKLPFKRKILFSNYPSFYSDWFKNLKEDILLELGGSVACAAFAVGFMLGSANIIMLGQDLAFEDKVETDYYAKGNKYNDKKTIIDKKRKIIIYPIKKDISRLDPQYSHIKELPDYSTLPLHYVKSWDGENKVPTHNHFIFFINWFESAARSLGHKRNLFNCTEGGAYLEGFKHKPLQEVLEFCKVATIKDHAVDEILNSVTTPPVDFTNNLKEDLQKMKKVLEDPKSTVKQVEQSNPLFDAYTIACKEDPQKMREYLKEFKERFIKMYNDLY